MSAYVRAHMRVRVRAGTYKRARACVFVRAYCCRRQLHIGKRSMVFGSIVRSIVRIRKQPMKKPVIWCSLANQQPCYKKLTCACSAENRARSAENRMCSLSAWVIVFSRSESRFTPISNGSTHFSMRTPSLCSKGWNCAIGVSMVIGEVWILGHFRLLKGFLFSWK